MRKTDRKIIFECMVGSNLYGTNGPDSDEDFMGVFLPSSDDLFGLQNPPQEDTKDEKVSLGPRNVKGDKDRKFYSVKRFLQLAGQGQSKQIEMLFAPLGMVYTSTSEWNRIIEQRDIFLSQCTIKPFIGFAMAQAHKAMVKGENLKLIRYLIDKIRRANIISTHIPLTTIIRQIQIAPVDLGSNVKTIYVMYDRELKTWADKDGALHIEIAGRKWPLTASVKLFHHNLRELEGRYGTRSEAAAEDGYDFKSLCHAYRLIFQAKELMKTGAIEFPLKPDIAKFLLTIRAGEYKADYFKEIEDNLTELRNIKSDLPKAVKWSKIEKMCKELTYEHLY